MELSEKEIAALEQSHNNADNEAVRELADIELAFVGGGIGDVIVG